MGTVTWNTDVNAPCCPGEILGEKRGQSILIQTDWDYPGTANTFGWSLHSVQRCPECGETLNVATDCDCFACPDCERIGKCCDHDGTDGTVDCHDCGMTATDFISAAYDWLTDNDGATADDPGYFE